MILPILDARQSVIDALSQNRPVIVPGPRPLPYVLAGRSAKAINREKGRVTGKPAVLVVSDISVVRPFLDLDEDQLRLAARLTAKELFHLIVPLKGSAPSWLAPAVSQMGLGFTMAWRHDLAFMFDEQGAIFASSANRTGDPPVGSAAEAARLFDDAVLVVDGGDDDEDGKAVSSGMMRLSRDRGVEAVRDGFQSRALGASIADYARQLTNAMQPG